MSLREQIEKLPTAEDDDRWIKRAEVLRIVAEHETAIAKPVLDLTTGGVGKQTTPERWDKSQPETQIPAYLCAPCNLEVEVGETFGQCPKCNKPMEMNPRWTGKSEPVAGMRWRKRLRTLFDHSKALGGTDWMNSADAAFFTIATALLRLAEVIESGRGQAVVPEGMRAAGLPPGTYIKIGLAGSIDEWMQQGGAVTVSAAYLLDQVNIYGDSLCGADKEGQR